MTLWPWPGSAAANRFAPYSSRTWSFLPKYQPTNGNITGQACPMYVANETWKIVSSVYLKTSGGESMKTPLIVFHACCKSPNSSAKVAHSGQVCQLLDAVACQFTYLFSLIYLLFNYYCELILFGLSAVPSLHKLNTNPKTYKNLSFKFTLSEFLSQARACKF